MALVQTAFIWVAYAVAVALVAVMASVFTFIYQAPRERSAIVVTVTIITLTSLLATILILPVDIALVSATSSVKLGVKKDWATPAKVEDILLTLKIVYYCLCSFDALLCLIVCPFTYFWYEEYDEVEAADGIQRFSQRFWAAFKYTTVFILLVVIIFLTGFFVPIAAHEGLPMELDYFKRLLSENRGDHAITFSLGLLISLGTLLYILYTAAGLALLPISFIRSAPSISAPELSQTTASALEQNRERQRQLEGRGAGRQGGLPAKDQRELEALVREERTLVRRERLAAEALGQGKSCFVRFWNNLKNLRYIPPYQINRRVVLLILAILIWVSMLITGIEKAKDSICKEKCGYLIALPANFQPIDMVFVKASEVFPVDYVLMILLVLFFFASSVSGLAAVGIRFLWISVFQIRKGRTPPQALLIATVMLSLIVLAVNYSIVTIVAPQYSVYGPQTFCDRPAQHLGQKPDCSRNPDQVHPCGSLFNNEANSTCTPTVVSTFINRITVNYPFYGALDFWAQFAFLGVFLIVFVTSLFRAPKFDMNEFDEAAENEEEEGLLASTGRKFGATWQDITGRAKGKSTPVDAGQSSQRNLDHDG